MTVYSGMFGNLLGWAGSWNSSFSSVLCTHMQRDTHAKRHTNPIPDTLGEFNDMSELTHDL